MNTKFYPRCLTCRIRNCSILNNCSRKVLEALSDAKQHYSFKKDEYIIKEGDPITGIFFIKSGVTKVELNGVVGRPLIIRLANPGSIFGHRLNEVHTTHPASVVAVEDTQVCFVPKENFTLLMTGDHEFHQQIVNHYLDEMKETEYRTLHLAHKTVRQKVADALLHVAKAYNYQRNASGMHIQLDRQDFADLASTTKEQVSKVLFDLKKEQLIHFRAKHFKYLDVEALKKIVEEQSVN